MHKLKKQSRVSHKECEGFYALVLVGLSSNVYRDPEKIAQSLARYKEVESVDIVAGKWELILHIRTKHQEAFYEFLKRVISGENGIVKTSSIVCLKRVKPDLS